MAANRTNVDVVVPLSNKAPPHCSHGPTLLFERFDQATKKTKQFYACSAFRDRKACSFFQLAEQKINKSENSTSILTTETYSHQLLRKRYFEFKKLSVNHRHVCCTCGLLLLNEDETTSHKSQGHSLKFKVQLKELRHPTSLFRPLDDNKTFAQYLFSKNTVNLVMDTVTRLHYTHVLCVGTPRIHEEVQCRRKAGANLNSLLLDLDERYAQIYSPSLYIKYNMFNHHFFESKSKDRLNQFLCEGGEHVLLITDPPFGGMVEALAATFTQISQILPQTKQSINNGHDVQANPIAMIWFFPYFMEARIVSTMPQLSMLDYKVDYENHILFNNQQKKKGSPVRMFTNIAQSLFILPQDDGYWFCHSCQRYSSPENWHCKECGSCTSKDGTKYVHCDICMRCVKSSRVHCFNCQVCQLKDHVCGQVKSAGCHLCGDLEHKRRQCPLRLHTKEDVQKSFPKKRKLEGASKSSMDKDKKKSKNKKIDL